MTTNEKRLARVKTLAHAVAAHAQAGDYTAFARDVDALHRAAKRVYTTSGNRIFWIAADFTAAANNTFNRDNEWFAQQNDIYVIGALERIDALTLTAEEI
jgi:phage host-nuclease inhibitor protein Gam